MCQTHPDTKPQSAAKIKTQEGSSSNDGGYHYNYESDNGINIAESGIGGVVANGQASWISKEGVPFSFSYVADEKGYQPIGFHLPTSPPIPSAIVRALKYLEEHAVKELEGQSEPKPEEDNLQAAGVNVLHWIKYVLIKIKQMRF